MTQSPMAGPGQAAAGRARGGVPEDRVLAILAVDHRASLERDLYGLTAPPTPAQAASVDRDATGGSTDRYDDELRPGHTLTVMAYLQDRRVDPAIWTVEGLDRHDDAVAVAAAAQRGGRQARCIVLGRPAPHDELEHWLEVAAPVPGWMGFAIGRSIWQDPLHAHLHHLCTAGEARRRIANTYLGYARYYLSARDGTLTEPEPVL